MRADLPIADRLPLAPTLLALVEDARDGSALRHAMSRVASLGFMFVQLSATQSGMRPRDLDQSARRDLLATLRRNELEVGGVDAWIPPRDFLDPALADRAATALHQIIELAADLNRVPVSVTLPALTDQTRTQVGLLRDSIALHADKFGVELADHAVPIAQQEHPVIRIGIDPAAWLAQSHDPAAAVLANAQRLGSARLCDLLTSGLRGPIGDPQEQQLDVTQYRIALSVSGYTRPVVLDARQWRGPWEGLQRSLATWNRTAAAL